jgi:hypothetical protein
MNYVVDDAISSVQEALQPLQKVRFRFGAAGFDCLAVRFHKLAQGPFLLVHDCTSNDV